MTTIKNILDKISIIVFSKEFKELTFGKVFIVVILLGTGIYLSIYLIAWLIYLIF